MNHGATSEIKNSKQILLVDDDPQSLKAMGLVVGSLAKVKTANSGNSAKELLKQQEFDVIVTDYSMNDGDGLELIRFIRENRIATPVILTTSYGSKDMVVKAINFQVFGFVDKPVVNADLEEKVLSALEFKNDQDTINSLARMGESTSELIHEITNPLLFIDLKSEQIKQDAESAKNQELAQSIDKVLKHSGRITSLISASKCVLRAEKNKNVLDLEKMELDSLFHEIEEYCTYKAKQNMVKLTVEKSPGLTITGDRSKLCSMFINLINNAIDAVCPLTERWVNLEAHVDGTNLVVSVTDSGKGIPKEVRENMFKTLFSTKGSKGSGLGLKIVTDIVKLHSGSIRINENCPNTQFVLTFPKHE